MSDLIALAVPLFFALIAVELVVSRIQGIRPYRFDDAIVDLACGIGQQVTKPFYFAALIVPYAWTYEHARMVTFASGSPWPWVLGFLGVDLAYYCWHRWTHQMNLGWTTHVVHHQSEEYNLAVALRQSLTSALSSWPFYLPVAVLGVPPPILLVHVALNTLYQFWIHTETIGKLGPVEWVFNTPSHHRVHHAINARYLDKNYAGVLIVWDRMFGTFVEESERPVYGTVEPLQSFDPLWANVQWAWLLARDTVAAPRLRDGIALWFRRPGWRPAGLAPFPAVSPESRVKYRPQGFAGAAPYVLVQFVPVTLATTAMLWFDRILPLRSLALPVALVLLTTVVWGGLFERKAWAVLLEIARLVAAAAVASWWFPGWAAPAWVFALGSAAWIGAIRIRAGR